MSIQTYSTDIKPPKDLVVRAYWPEMGRDVDSKWTGRRWLRFNELFGGYDPIPHSNPTSWKHKTNL